MPLGHTHEEFVRLWQRSCSVREVANAILDRMPDVPRTAAQVESYMQMASALASRYRIKGGVPLKRMCGSKKTNFVDLRRVCAEAASEAKPGVADVVQGGATPPDLTKTP